MEVSLEMPDLTALPAASQAGTRACRNTIPKPPGLTPVTPLPDTMKHARISALLLSSLLLCTGLHAKERQGEQVESLNGTWNFTTDSQAATSGSGPWDKMEVPGNWDTVPQYSTYRGIAWYQREFTVPADWKGKRVRLKFDSVYHIAEVTLNGQVLGKHVGGYTPFDFDVTDKVNYGGTNTLLVSADSSYKRGAWWAWGGISRDVSLIANNDARIVWQHITADPNLTTGAASLTIQYKVANSGDKPLPVEVASQIAGTSIAPLTAKGIVPAKGESILEAGTILPKKDVRLWHFDHPNLYTCDTTLTTGKTVLNSASDRFGIRKIEVTKDGLFLNGEQIRAGGYNRVSDSNKTGSTEPDSLIKGDVDLMKKSGAVMARLMHMPLAPNLLDYLDEKGMLIFSEIPVWGDNDPQKSKDNPRTKQWLKEMIERDYNHPCIIGWSPGNELTGHMDYVASMKDYIRKELDPHRLISYASFTAARKEYNPTNDPVSAVDLAMLNTYSGNPNSFAGAAAAVRSKWPDKALFFSEYGDVQIGGGLDARIKNIDGIWASIAKNPWVIGGALWTFNDYRSDYKGTPASGNREWGVVTVDRELKAAYWQIRKLYSPVHSLSAENGTLAIVPRKRSEIPSYTVRGYIVEWKLKDAAGKVTSQGSIPVPDLAPDAAAWTAPIPGAKSAAALSVTLVTPTGYDVADWNSAETKKP